MQKALSRFLAAVAVVALLTPAAFAAPFRSAESPRLIERLSGEAASWLVYRLSTPRVTGQSVQPRTKCGGAVDPNGCPPIPPPSCTVNCR